MIDDEKYGSHHEHRPTLTGTGNRISKKQIVNKLLQGTTALQQ